MTTSPSEATYFESKLDTLAQVIDQARESAQHYRLAIQEILTCPEANAAGAFAAYQGKESIPEGIAEVLPSEKPQEAIDRAVKRLISRVSEVINARRKRFMNLVTGKNGLYQGMETTQLGAHVLEKERLKSYESDFPETYRYLADEDRNVGTRRALQGVGKEAILARSKQYYYFDHAALKKVQAKTPGIYAEIMRQYDGINLLLDSEFKEVRLSQVSDKKERDGIRFMMMTLLDHQRNLLLNLLNILLILQRNDINVFLKGKATDEEKSAWSEDPFLQEAISSASQSHIDQLNRLLQAHTDQYVGLLLGTSESVEPLEDEGLIGMATELVRKFAQGLARDHRLTDVKDRILSKTIRQSRDSDNPFAIVMQCLLRFFEEEKTGKFSDVSVNMMYGGAGIAFFDSSLRKILRHLPGNEGLKIPKVLSLLYSKYSTEGMELAVDEDDIAARNVTVFDDNSATGGTLQTVEETIDQRAAEVTGSVTDIYPTHGHVRLERLAQLIPTSTHMPNKVFANGSEAAAYGEGKLDQEMRPAA